MRVDELAPAPGSVKRKKRMGRGIGGKGGKTAGAGTKGQQSRGRGKVARGFEGGQMPLKQRVPKLKGFNNPFRVEYYAVNLDAINELGLSEVNPEILVDKGAAHKGTFIKFSVVAKSRSLSKCRHMQCQRPLSKQSLLPVVQSPSCLFRSRFVLLLRATNSPTANHD